MKWILLMPITWTNTSAGESTQIIVGWIWRESKPLKIWKNQWHKSVGESTQMAIHYCPPMADEREECFNSRWSHKNCLHATFSQICIHTPPYEARTLYLRWRIRVRHVSDTLERVFIFFLNYGHALNTFGIRLGHIFQILDTILNFSVIMLNKIRA